MAEDLSTYTEVDPNSHISATSSRATGAGINRNETAYLYCDKGADYFDALDIDFDIRATNLDDNDILGVFGISNTLNHIGAFGNDDIKIVFYYPSGGSRRLYILGGGANDYMVITLNTTYYCTLERASGNATVTLKVYSDSERTTLLDTLTVSISTASTKHRYIFVLSSQNTSNNYAASGYTENVILDGTPPVETPTIEGYGDSIMAGAGVTVPSDTHIYKTADALGYDFVNHGVSSYGVADVAHDAGLYAKTIAVDEIYLFQGWPNDTYSYHEDENGESIFKAGLTAISAHVLIPDAAKVYASAATLGGTWTNPTIYNRSKKSVVNGSTASFTVSGNTVAIATTRLVTNPGSFTVTIDSVDKGSISMSPCINNHLSKAFCPQIHFYEGLSAGSHTVVLTAVSNGTTIAQVDWVAGFNAGAIPSNWPLLIFGGQLKCIWPGYTYFTEAEGAAWNGYIEDVYDILVGYGFHIRFVDLWNTITANSTNIQADNIHPKAAGHTAMSAEFVPFFHPVVRQLIRGGIRSMAGGLA